VLLDEFPDGWFVPLQRALVPPALVGGVPFGFGVLNGTFTMAMTLGAQKYWVGLVGLALHGIAMAAIKVDPYFFDVLKEHVRSKSYYEV
jgi:type IV secretion system protein TrbD